MKEIPLQIVGSNTYGRYSTMSSSKTFNMFVADDWLVPFAGYKKILTISEQAEGRGIFNSVRLGKIIIVINNGVYTIDKNFSFAKVGSLETFSGDVYIDENDAYQIAICDKKNIYIYNYNDNSFGKASLEEGFLPGYIAFQDGYFIAPMIGQPKWRLSAPNNGLIWSSASNNVGMLQGKPDDAMACIPIPSRMGALFVMGKSITEHWIDVGSTLFPYKRSSGFNVDYGCANQSTIACGDSFVVWLSVNEKSGPVIMYSNGGDAIPISNDGINFKLSQIKHPEYAYAFLFKQDGKLFYVLTFTNKEDNYTLLCDLESKKFYSLCGKDMGAFIAKKTVQFNNNYYFISFIDGCLYRLSSEYTTFDGEEIHRIRVCDTISSPDSSQFIINNLSFSIEQGHNISQKEQVIDFAVSRNNSSSFGNYLRYTMNPLGRRINKVSYYHLGRANSFTPQFRFYGFDRFVVNNGIVRIYQ